MNVDMNNTCPRMGIGVPAAPEEIVFAPGPLTLPGFIYSSRNNYENVDLLIAGCGGSTIGSTGNGSGGSSSNLERGEGGCGEGG